MKQANRLPRWILRFSMSGLLVLSASLCVSAQDAKPAGPSDSLAATVHDLQTQVQELRTVVDAMRSEAEESRAESAELRRELEATRTQLAGTGALSSTSPEPAAPAPALSNTEEAAAKPVHARSLGERLTALEESSQLLGDKVDEQHQTKVESASKYHLRLSGIVLLNLYANRGTTDSQDLPSYVTVPNGYLAGGNVGATMRQSELGLEVFGPRVFGARTSGDFQADFGGGFANTANGVDSGLFRMRTATIRMDWQRTSLVAGQDSFFLSPRAPTSFASLALPSFSYAGNLWGWIPQVRIEHRFDVSEGQSFSVQAGILDNVSGEPPFTQYARLPDAGEKSSQPAYGTRVAWRGTVLGQTVSLGTGGYYTPQNWGFARKVDGWAGMTDWEIPLTQWASLSGEFYRGRALGGLGGGIGRSVLFSGSPLDPTSQVRGLNSAGGWSQLKIKATSKLEFNGAFGLDNAFAADLRAFPAAVSYLDPTLARNRGSLVNFIYRPRSNLLFSTEYKHLRTSHTDDEKYPADQVNIVMGILF